jgi:hypothetical protein
MHNNAKHESINFLASPRVPSTQRAISIGSSCARNWRCAICAPAGRSAAYMLCFKAIIHGPGAQVTAAAAAAESFYLLMALM